MTPDLSNAICYFRVSSKGQFEELHSFESYLYSFKKLGFEDSQIYSDVASGDDCSREGYNLVLKRIREGIKVVYVPAFDRFTRSVSGWEEALKDFETCGAKIQILGGALMGFDTPEEKLISRNMALYAQYEKDKIRYRAKKGFEFGRSQGRAFQKIFGYVLDKNSSKLVRDLSEFVPGITRWDVAREVIEKFLELEGNIYSTIAFLITKYGFENSGSQNNSYPKSYLGMHYWLLSESIRGNLEYLVRNRKAGDEPVIFYNTHEPLISEFESDLIKKFLTKLSRQKYKKKMKSPFGGIAFCANCGSHFAVVEARTKTNIILYFRCYKGKYGDRSDRRRGIPVPNPCNRNANGFTVEKLDNIVIGELTKKAQEISKNFLEDVEQEDSEIEESQEIKKLRDQIRKYESLSYNDPDLLPLIEKKRLELSALLEQEGEDNSSQILLREKLVAIFSNPDFWEIASIVEKSIVYQDFIQRIDIDTLTMDIRITWKI